MTRLASLALVLSLSCAPALVMFTPTSAVAGSAHAQSDGASSQPHGYWMSRDFQRLAFWQSSQGGSRR